jgi:hypothetical protein
MSEAVLLEETMEVVREAHNRGEWNQREWGSTTQGCGTAYCFAGWRIVQDGGRLVGANTFVMLDGTQLHGAEIGEYSRKRFGLSREQAMTLFASNNKFSDLEDLVKEYARAA